MPPRPTGPEWYGSVLPYLFFLPFFLKSLTDPAELRIIKTREVNVAALRLRVMYELSFGSPPLLFFCLFSFSQFSSKPLTDPAGLRIIKTREESVKAWCRIISVTVWAKNEGVPNSSECKLPSGRPSLIFLSFFLSAIFR